MAISEHVPVALKAKTTEDLQKQLLKVQVTAGARVQILSIYFDAERKEHVLWYYPYKNAGTYSM